MFVVIAIVSLLLGGVMFLLKNANIEMDGILANLESFVPLFCSVLMMLFYFISYQISYKIFLKREL